MINVRQQQLSEQFQIFRCSMLYYIYDVISDQFNNNSLQMKKHNIYIYPLQGKVIFPYHQYRFTINSHSYQPETFDNLIGFVTKLDDLKDHKNIQKIQGLSRFGTLLKIQKSDIVAGYINAEKTKIFNVNYLGLTFARFRILSVVRTENRYLASIQIFNDQIPKEVEMILEKKKSLQNLKKELKLYYDCKLKNLEADIAKDKLEAETSINKLIFRAVDDLEISFMEKIKFLQFAKVDARIQFLMSAISEKTENMKSVFGLEDKVRQQMYKNQNKRKPTQTHPFFDGLGRDGRGDSNKELTQKIASKKLPQYVKSQIEKQMKRMGGETQKAVSQKYIETLLEIPWLQSTQDIKDIALAQKILNEDHTGLKQVKERILQFLAVKFRNGNSKGNIICLHGPPGVGKTSIAKSIAKSLGKQFTRISLGGMNDEAQLRGHRRTYVAALPGVIIRALTKAKSNNPVILLDEIQKIGKSYKGDPQHALLQILDPSQNSSFVDHYVGLPVDLSKVMFICTANTLQLSTPLLNRLQLIDVPGYSRQEKFEIARNHLIPLQIKECGVEGLVQFQSEGLKEIVKYSHQMGVRQLQRKLSKICRKVARKGQKECITKQKVEDYLGKRIENQLWSGIGVVNGLAWTQMGGKVLTVEALQYSSSRQKIEVTGQLGDVMKESVNIAFQWIKANLNELDVSGPFNQQLTFEEKLKYLEKLSLHIHFPEGATKKDGPSAGVTIVTCIASLLLRVPPREQLAMTGQITLSGKVLPVGGVRQKCIAAINEGIKHIIIPYANLKDLDKIDSQLRKNVQFYPVKKIKDVLAISFPGLVQKSTPKL